MNFKKYYFNEDDKFVNLDNDKSGKTLGDIDSKEEKFPKIINRIISQLNVGEVDEMLNILLKDKSNLEKYRKDFKNLFLRFSMNANNLKKLAKTVRGENTFDVTNNFSINDMYQHYNKFAKNAVHEKIYNALFNYIPGGGAAGQVGRGELVLALLSKLSSPSGGKGDLEDTDGSKIEVKFNLARFAGPANANQISGPEVIKNVSKLIGNEITSKTTGKEFFNKVYEHIKKKPNDLKKVLTLMVNHRNIKLPPEALSINIKNIEDLKSLALAIQANTYHEIEKMDKIFFIDLNKNIKILNFSNFRNLYKFVKENLGNTGGWSSSKPAFLFKVL